MKLLIKRLLSYLPSAVPVGLTEFNDWADSIIELSGSYADADSMKWAIASMLIHLPPTKAYVTKQFFVRCLRKAAANQVASAVFQEIKTKQEAAAKASESTQEATTTSEPAQPVVTSNETVSP